MSNAVLNVAALLSLMAAALVPLRHQAGRDALFWSGLGVAAAGTTVWAVVQLGQSWHTGIAVALWVSIAATVLLFAAVVALSRDAWRLMPLLLPYLLVLGVLASIFHAHTGPAMPRVATDVWLDAHILVSVLTYALLTLAAVAAWAAFLQERALKRKQPTRLTRILPAVAVSEGLATRLLLASEVVLGVGIVTGIAAQVTHSGAWMTLDHKTLLSLLAFVVIGALLVARHVTGVRGRQAARLVLVAYLLLTLAYLGVKFVTDVLIA